MSSLREEILRVLNEQEGVVFARPAIVHRGMYTGRGIIAPNTQPTQDMVDERGYLPVEWWIMSRTAARNAVPVENEGITRLLINDRTVLLPEALQEAGVELMGDHVHLWPLTKVLDIGGVPKLPVLSEVHSEDSMDKEVPPIPCHVHAGDVVVTGSRAHCTGHGKTEAYFFPPLHVPPYNLRLGSVKTRLGLKSDVKKEEVLGALSQFGRTDDLYTLLNEFEIKPWETWTIEQKVIHAPGPWLTFEIQLPQDDFHLLAWQLGSAIPEADLPAAIEAYHLRGLEGDRQLLEETLDWEVNVDPGFRQRWWRECEVLEEGQWGRRLRLFYHIFYGEGYVVRPGEKYSRDANTRPFAGIVWSGEGAINGQRLDCSSQSHKEFLVAPGYTMQLHNTSPTADLMVFAVFPLTHAQCSD